MKLHEFILFEGYKEAKQEFSQHGNEQEVQQSIEQYKDLVKRKQATDNERNIDWWRKQGWPSFKQFVNVRSQRQSNTQLKNQRKKQGDSIVLKETDQWLIVIPLNKSASCFHGKDTDWCTTKPNQNQYEEYFYDNHIVMIYCLQKQTGKKWAIAYNKDVDEMELFDQQDNEIDKEEFKQQTGLNADNIVSLINSSHQGKIDSARSDYKAKKSQISEHLQKKETQNQRSEQIENMLMEVKDPYLFVEYIMHAGEHKDYPSIFQRLAINSIISSMKDRDHYLKQIVPYFAKLDKKVLNTIAEKFPVVLWEVDPSNTTPETYIPVLEKRPDRVNSIPTEHINDKLIKTAIQSATSKSEMREVKEGLMNKLGGIIFEKNQKQSELETLNEQYDKAKSVLQQIKNGEIQPHDKDHMIEVLTQNIEKYRNKIKELQHDVKTITKTLSNINIDPSIRDIREINIDRFMDSYK